MSTNIKKQTNKRLTNIGTQRRQSDVATFCCGKCNKLRFLRDEGWGTVRVSGVHKTCDPHRARQAVRLARPSWGQRAYNETCEELHRRHAQGRIAFAY